MMQVISFLMQYAEELSLFMSSLTTVLLLITLHRIKRVSKMVQAVAGNTNESVKAQPIYEKSDVSLIDRSEQAETESEKNSQTQAELLSEVLDEVFL